MKLVRHLADALSRLSERAGRERARRHLLSCSDRVLADAGFSRELLRSGDRAWPWRVADEAAPVRSPIGPRAVSGAAIPPAATFAPSTAAGSPHRLPHGDRRAA